nr:YaiI/YqxD family protein [Cytobacillus spongiae]
MGNQRIVVDADSCPVKQEIVEIGRRFSTEIMMVASYAHMMNELTEATWKFVDSSREAADLYIMNHVRKDDVVVTQDIGLASTLLPKQVYVLSPKGILYDEKDIQTALDMRYLSAKARRQGKYGKGPKPYSSQDRDRFVNQLTKILSNFAGKY